MPLVTGETGGEHSPLPHTEIAEVLAIVDAVYRQHGQERVVEGMVCPQTGAPLPYPADYLNIVTPAEVITQPLANGGTRYIMSGRTRPFEGSVDNQHYRDVTRRFNPGLLQGDEFQRFPAGIEVTYAQDIYPDDPAKNDLIIIVRIRDPYRLQGDGIPYTAVGDTDLVVAYSIQNMTIQHGDEMNIRSAVLDLFHGMQAEGIRPEDGGILKLLSNWPHQVDATRRRYVGDGVQAFLRIMAKVSQMCGEHYVRIADKTATAYNKKATRLGEHRQQRHILLPGLPRKVAQDAMATIFGIVAMSELSQGIFEGVDNGRLYFRGRQDVLTPTVFDRAHEVFRDRIAFLSGNVIGCDDVWDEIQRRGKGPQWDAHQKLVQQLPGIDVSTGRMDWWLLYSPAFRGALRRLVMREGVMQKVAEAGMVMSTDIMASYGELYALTILDFVRTLNRLTQMLLPDGRRVPIYPEAFDPRTPPDDYELLRHFMGADPFVAEVAEGDTVLVEIAREEICAE